MNANDQEKHLLEKTKDLLDQGTENLNNQTRQRLKNVRINALRAVEEKRWGFFTPLRWIVVGGFAAAMISVAASLLWLPRSPEVLPASQIDDFEIITSRDHIEFYQNLDFYHWLVTPGNNPTKGKASGYPT